MILAGERLPPLSCRGVLLIGDPHVGSRRPGRRTDADWPSPILAKLERCAALANEHDLFPVVLGDLFDRPVEPDVALKARLVRVLRSFRRRPLVNVGNHDMTHTTLSDDDSLTLLGLCDVVDVVTVSGPVVELDLGEGRLGLGATPYAQPIPDDVRGAFTAGVRGVWLTHHDIVFQASYPGAVAPHAIAGCDLVVNGHVHRTQKAVMAGGTRWFNPGSLIRQSVDLRDHEPRAWWLGPHGDPRPLALPFERDVFDLTGRLVATASESRVAAVESAFVSLLRAQGPENAARTDDAALIREVVEATFEERETPPAVRAIVRSLLDEAVERGGGAGR